MQCACSNGVNVYDYRSQVGARRQIAECWRSVGKLGGYTGSPKSMKPAKAEEHTKIINTKAA